MRLNIKLSKNSIFRRLLTIIKSKINDSLHFCFDGIGQKSIIFFKIVRIFTKSFYNCALLPYEWLDRLSNQNILIQNKNFISYGPRYIYNTNVSTAIVTCPDVCWRVIRNSIVTADSSSVVVQEKKILIERCGRDNQDYYNYSTGQIKWHGRKNALVKFSSNIIRSKKGIFLGGNGASNYYHWMVEIFTKSMFISSLPEKYLDFPIFFSVDVKNIPQFNAMIDIISENREIVWMNPHQSYSFEEMVYIDSVNNIPFNVVGKHKLSVSDIVINLDSILWLRKIFLDKFSQSFSCSTLVSKRVFLYRENSRRHYNQDKVKLLLDSLGFISVDFSEIGFMQQVELFNNADWIVGPTGAEWSNLVFSKRGLKCLVWMANEIGDFSAFSNIAACVDADLVYLTYSVDVNQTANLFEKCYFLDVEKLNNALVLHGLNI